NLYKKKIDFNGNSIFGNNPTGQLIFNKGKLFGATNYGGTNELGVLFEWDLFNNQYNKKLDLNYQNIPEYGQRSWPNQTNITLQNGKFYGTTYMGGSNGAGLIFEWDPATNIYNKKYDFDGSNGKNPVSELIFYSGKFYGMTNAGGTADAGVIFEWDPVTNIF